MTTTIDTVAVLIGQWKSGTADGVADFAADVGVTVAVARAWARRNSIPGRYWASIVAAAERRGLSHVSVEVLASLHDLRRSTAA